MEERPNALLLKFPGTNADVETARALEVAGFSTETLPIPIVTRERIASAKLVVISGGFSYGDYIMAGRVAQLETQRRLGDALHSFVADGGYALGICNGFQILTRLGLLPKGALVNNTSGRFTCRWVGLHNRAPKNAFLRELPEEIEFPVAHAEGRFVAHEGAAEQYEKEGLVTLSYARDVNGSQRQIAGLQDTTGRVFGLMPHPERFLFKRHHYDPDWNDDPQWGWGYYFFHSIYLEVAGLRGIDASADVGVLA
jgi:phosphoribosylformylglycinamidine synthase I